MMEQHKVPMILPAWIRNHATDAEIATWVKLNWINDLYMYAENCEDNEVFDANEVLAKNQSNDASTD